VSLRQQVADNKAAHASGAARYKNRRQG